MITTDASGAFVHPPSWVVIVRQAARNCALLAGLLLCLLALLVVVSVIGRTLLRRPVPGDFELVEMGTAIVLFLCLPYCQLERGNLLVDFFLSGASLKIKAALDACAAALAGLLALLFAWRMTVGMIDAIAYADISMILGLPLWWAYPFAVGSFLLLAAACVVTLVQDLGGHRW